MWCSGVFCLDGLDLLTLEKGEETQVPADILVFDVDPELVGARKALTSGTAEMKETTGTAVETIGKLMEKAKPVGEAAREFIFDPTNKLMNKLQLYITIIFFSSLLLSCNGSSQNQIMLTKAKNQAFKQAHVNGKLVNEGFERCRLFVKDWLAYADPTTGLIPRNLYKDTDIWNAKDAAADNYPFMVLTALTPTLSFLGKEHILIWFYQNHTDCRKK